MFGFSSLTAGMQHCAGSAIGSASGPGMNCTCVPTYGCQDNWATAQPQVQQGCTASAIASVRTHIAQGRQLDIVSGAVLLGVVAEHGGAVEGAVVLREVQPALEAVGALPTHTNANDVGGAAGHRAAESGWMAFVWVLVLAHCWGQLQGRARK